MEFLPSNTRVGMQRKTQAHLACADEVGAEAVLLLVVEEDRPVRAVPHIASVGPPGRV